MAGTVSKQHSPNPTAFSAYMANKNCDPDKITVPGYDNPSPSVPKDHVDLSPAARGHAESHQADEKPTTWQQVQNFFRGHH